MLDQPTVALGEQLQSAANIAAYVLSTAGTILVLTSFYRLGITGTYLGDYFGILMDEMVTGFPFTILANPMYVGTTMNFLAGALWLASPAGALVTVWVYFVYMAAISFEEYVCARPHSNFAARLILTRTSLSLSLSLSLVRGCRPWTHWIYAQRDKASKRTASKPSSSARAKKIA